MTVDAREPYKRYPYTGIGDYDFTFTTYLEEDLRISYLDIDGTSTDLVINVGYTVSLLEDFSGGTVDILDASIPEEGFLDIVRLLPLEQSTSWVNNHALPMELLEHSFDRLVMMLQQLDGELAGYIRVTNWYGDWAADTDYIVNNMVTAPDRSIYVCIGDHTASSASNGFEDDLASGYWMLVIDIETIYTLTEQASQSAVDAEASKVAAEAAQVSSAESESNSSNSEANSALSENNSSNCAAEAHADRILAEAAAETAEGLVGIGERTDAISTDYYSATAGQTTFTITEPTYPANVFVFMNSRKLRVAEDYTLTGDPATAVVLLEGVELNDELDIVSMQTYDLTGMTSDLVAAVAAAEAAQAAAESARDAAASSEINAEISRENSQSWADASEAAAEESYNWSMDARSVACQDLAAIQAIVDSSANFVDVFIYDTSKDSDGGAWRKRCQDLSWYNETLNTSTRGKTREFPAVCLVVAETDTVTLYDLTDPSVPMWMVFTWVSDFNLLGYGNRASSSITMLQGVLCKGSNVGDGLFLADFLKDMGFRYSAGEYSTTSYSIKDRIGGIDYVGTGINPIVNAYVNDVTMTVLPDAPIDQVTELPITTKLVPTAAGASWIKDDGTVVDATGAVNLVAADINSSGLSVMVSASTVYVFNNIPSSDVALTSADYITSPVGTITSVNLNGYDIIIGTSEGFIVTKYNEISPTDSMAFQITKDYFSGIMKGDIKLATLADSVAGDIEELWTGTTTPDSGWTDNLDGTYTCDGTTGGIKITGSATPLSGKTVFAKMTIDSLTAGSVTIPYDGNSSNRTYVTAIQEHSHTFEVTTGQPSFLMYSNGFAGTVSLVSIVEAIEDRSVNDNPLQVVGTITKAPVAIGSELMAYSGFGTNDYIEQPYNSDLDFGTGDFYVMGWVKPNAVGDQEILERNGVSPGQFIRIWLHSSGNLYARIYDGSNAATAILPYIADQLIFFVAKREGNDWILYLNGSTNIGDATAVTTVSNTAAVVRIGLNMAGTNPFDNGFLSLFRMGAGAPSDEQIKDIYEMEKKLFEENAEYTLLGSNDSVKALSFDEVTNKLSVLTDVVNQFQGVVSANQEVLNGGGVAIDTYKDGLAVATSAETIYTRPAFFLREELEMNHACCMIAQEDPIPHVSTGVGQTEIQTPLGYYPVMVYDAGLKVQFTVTNDGYYRYVSISSSTGDVEIMMRRSN